MCLTTWPTFPRLSELGGQGVNSGNTFMSMTCTRRRSVAAPPAQVMHGTSSDEALMERIADRDQLAMRALFGRHRTALYRWLVRLVGDAALAEDLLSDVFLDVWRQAAVFEGRSSVSTWLLAIARYKALSARRRRTDAELVLQKKNRDEILRRSVARLSPVHGEIIDLVYFHGKSVKDVAEIVGLNEATVKTRMFYARKKLAELAAVA